MFRGASASIAGSTLAPTKRRLASSLGEATKQHALQACMVGCPYDGICVTDLGEALSLLASTPHQDKALVAELLLPHGNNAAKHQLVAGSMGCTVPPALC